MLRNRYYRTDLFALEPQLGVLFEPQLELLDEVEGAVITGYAIVERAGGQDQCTWPNLWRIISGGSAGRRACWRPTGG